MYKLAHACVFQPQLGVTYSCSNVLVIMDYYGFMVSGDYYIVGSDFLYTNWLANNPTAPIDASQQQCASIAWSTNSANSGYWTNDACNSSKFFICQSGE